MRCLTRAFVPGFKAVGWIGTETKSETKNIIPQPATLPILHHHSLPSLRTSNRMHQEAGRQCPGCQQYFRPRGYANHLKLTRDPRCKSIRNSVFRLTSGMVSHRSDHIPAAGPSISPSPPTRQPSRMFNNLDSDTEMPDIEDEDWYPPPMEIDINPLSGRSAGTNGHTTSRQDGVYQLPNTITPPVPSVPIVIDSDDSDSSDNDDDNIEETAHQSNQDSTPPCSRFSRFCARATGAHCGHP